MQIQGLNVLDLGVKDTKMNSKAPPGKKKHHKEKTIHTAGTMRTSQ
jgi:hypothetical protein